MDKTNTFVTLFSTFEFKKKKTSNFPLASQIKWNFYFFILGFNSKLPLVLENNLCHIMILNYHIIRMILIMKKNSIYNFFFYNVHQINIMKCLEKETIHKIFQVFSKTWFKYEFNFCVFLNILSPKLKIL
jgi:hypothetical protein